MRLQVVVTTYILSNNKFYKMAVNEVVSTNICDEEVMKKFVVPYFEGNSSYANPNDCVIRKVGTTKGVRTRETSTVRAVSGAHAGEAECAHYHGFLGAQDNEQDHLRDLQARHEDPEQGK